MKGLFGNSLRIGDDAVHGFLSVHVGVVLVHAAVAVGDRFGEEGEHGEDEQEDDERGPVLERGDMPAGTETPEKPLGGAEADVELDEEKEGEEGEGLPDVLEHVVAHLVAEDKGDLVRCGLDDGGVPDDDAFGGADAGDVGVEAGDFVAGSHKEHTVRWDGDAAALDNLLEALDEGGVGFGEGLEAMKEWVDEDGCDEDAEDDQEHGGNAEPEPPVSRGSADSPEEQEDERGADDEGEREGLRLVSEPALPALDGLGVEEREVVAVKVEGKVGEAGDGEQKRGEEESLEPAAAGATGGEGFKARGGAGGEQEHEDEDAPELAGKAEDGPLAGVTNRLPEFFGREMVGGLVVLRSVRSAAAGACGGLLVSRRRRGCARACEKGEKREQKGRDRAEVRLHGVFTLCGCLGSRFLRPPQAASYLTGPARVLKGTGSRPGMHRV